MKSELNIEERKPIWIALSDFYLDNELQDSDFRHIAFKIKESSYSLEEVKRINKNEIFPVLYHNLISVAGVWTGFQEDWLITEIIKKLQKKSLCSSFIEMIQYKRLKWIFTDYWDKLEVEYKTSIYKLP